MSVYLRFTVDAGEESRLDRVLSDRLEGVSRRRVQALIRSGAVLLNGRRAKKGDAAIAGAEVTLLAAPTTEESLRPAPDPDAPLEMLYEDAFLVAVAKPAGMPSHPMRPGERGTLANALVARFAECRAVGEDPREAGLAHRLDIGTSGVLLVARNADSWRALREAFTAHRVQKHYLALVEGQVRADGRCDAPLSQRGKRVVVSDRPDALPAVTEWRVVERIGERTLLRCATRYGRMHQVRVHLAHSGWPLVGDPTYARTPAGDLPLLGHFLHAESVALSHPTTGAALRVEAPLPADREATLAALRGLARSE